MKLYKGSFIYFLINPGVFFFLLHIFMLLLYYLVPQKILELSFQNILPYYPNFLYLLLHITLIISYVFGVILSAYFYKNKTNFVLSKKRINHHYQFLKIIFIVSTILSSISIIYIFIFIVNGNMFHYLFLGVGNIFKSYVYKNLSIIIMGRHLILTSYISYLILSNYYNFKSKIYLVLLSLNTLILFLFTSSRLTPVFLFLIYIFLKIFFHKINFKKLYRISILILFIFIMGVFYRSIGTWENVAGDQVSFYFLPFFEIFSYLFTPLSYTFAIYEKVNNLNLDVVLPYTFNVIYTVFNLPMVNTPIRDAIQNYYNPNFNQIGIFGTFFGTYGVFSYFVLFFYGYLSGIIYYTSRKSILSLMLLPIVLLSIFDSIRGFLLFQNILAANILFICFVYIIYVFLKKIYPNNKKKFT
jgi:hypothetical protein